MASRPTQVSVGGIVNPLEGLQQGLTGATDLYGKYLDRKRQDSLLALKEEELGWKKDDRARAEAQRELLKTYDPRVGELGGRGVDANALRGYSSKAGQDVSTILGRYGVGADKSIGSLSAEDQKKLGADLSSLAGKMQPELSGLGTKEDVERLVLKDIQKATGDPVLAKQLGESYGSQYIDRKTLEAAEKAATEEAAKRLKEMKDNVTTLAKAEGVGSTASFKSGGGSTSGSKLTPSDVLYSNEDAKEFGKSLNLSATDMLKLNWDERRAADLMISGIDKRPKVSAKVREKALENLVDRGILDDNLKGKNEEDQLSMYLQEIDKAQAAVDSIGKGGSSSSKFIGRGDYTPAEKKILSALSPQQKSYADIQKARGAAAYGGLLQKAIEAEKSKAASGGQTGSANTGMQTTGGSTSTPTRPRDGEGGLSAEEFAELDRQMQIDALLDRAVEQENTRKVSSFMQRMVNTPSPFPEDNQEKPEEELNGVAKVAKQDYENFVALKKANPKLDPLNVREAELNNRYLRSRNLTEEELKGTVDFPVTQYRGLSDKPLETSTPLLNLVGAKAALDLLRRGATKTLPVDVARQNRLNVINEEARVANRINALKGKKALRPSKPESLKYNPLLPTQPRAGIKGEVSPTESLRLQEWLRANPS